MHFLLTKTILASNKPKGFRNSRQFRLTSGMFKANLFYAQLNSHYSEIS